MAEREKVSGFRLPQGTLDKLDELIDQGVIKNRTDGVISAIEMFYDSSKYDTNTGKITDLISWATESPQIASEWHLFPVGTMFPIFRKNGNRMILTKWGPDGVELVREVNGNRLIIYARKDDEGFGVAGKRDYTFLCRSKEMTEEETNEAVKRLESEFKKSKTDEKKEHDTD